MQHADDAPRRKILLYVNQIYLNERSGQASFERGVVDAMIKRAQREQDFDVRLFTVHRPENPPPPDGRVWSYPLDKRSYWRYVGHQIALLGALFTALWRHRGADVALYVRYSPAMLAPVVLSAVFRRPLVFRTGPVFEGLRDYKNENRWWVHAAVRAGLRSFCGRAKRVITATEPAARWLARIDARALGKTVIIPNGADPSKMPLLPPDRDRWKVPEGPLLLGYVGSLSEPQGLDVVVRAVGILNASGGPRVHLLVVGDGPARAKWMDLSNSLGVGSDITWAGSQPHDDVPSAIATCDLMVLPDSKESAEVRGVSAMKLFEYLACDKFVLAGRCPDLEFLETHQVGRLIEFGNSPAWAKVITEELAHPRPPLAGRARALVVREYSFDAVAEKIWKCCFE